MVHRKSNSSNGRIVMLQDYLSLLNKQTTKQSDVSYMGVVDAKAESKDTMMYILSQVDHELRMKTTRRKYVLAEGDTNHTTHYRP